jgi:outer membrane receptor protein involved in Fe transport
VIARDSFWLLAIVAAPIPVMAQEAAPSPAKPEDKKPELDAVVVTAPSQAEERMEIDRRSYSVGREIQAQTGTLADLLRTVPSVDVDLQGNVSLRGDAGVQITIDGKPAGMFRGDGRSQAVQSLPANQFERVEVISNPSAAESAEGSAGIINLVTKTGRGAGATGSIRLSVGTLGQYAGGVTLNHNSAKLALTGDVSYRGADPQTFRTVDARRVTSLAGESGHLITTRYRGHGRIFTGRAGADYDLDDRTRFGVQARHMVMSGSQPGFESYEDRAPLGRVSRSVRDMGDSPFWNDTTEGSLSFRRKLGQDRQLTADLRQERSTYEFERPDRVSRLEPVAPDIFGDFHTRAIINTTGGKLNYQRPLADAGEFKAGYELRIEDNRYWSVVAFGAAPDSLIADPGLSSEFEYRAEINGVFATYQRPLGELTMLAGLRLENARMTTAADGLTATTERLRPYPSLHLSRPLDELRKLSASYSRRVDRPNPFQLSPAVSYQNERAIFRGNPKLTPPETDSFELGYEDRTPGQTRTVTLFYRQIHDPILQLTRELDSGMLLTQPENRDDSTRAGASVSLNRKFGEALTFTLSGDIYWTRIQGFEERYRSAFAGQGRASLSWQATPADVFQADVRASGPTLTPQGERTGYTILNLGYRRRLTPTLFAVVTAQNVFDSADLADKVRTPTLVYRRSFRGLPPTIVFGLTYNFGGGPKAPQAPAFDFGAAPS